MLAVPKRGMAQQFSPGGKVVFSGHSNLSFLCMTQCLNTIYKVIQKRVGEKAFESGVEQQQNWGEPSSASQQTGISAKMKV